MAGDGGTIKTHVPFPTAMEDLDTCKENFSEDCSWFVEEFTKLMLSYKLTWGTYRSSVLHTAALEREIRSLVQP